MNTKELSPICRQVRRDIITMTANAGSGHPGGSLSAVELMTSVFFNHMRVDPKNPHDPDRDRFILSKGHCGHVLYNIFVDKGLYTKEELWSEYNQVGGRFGMHPNFHYLKGIEASTGSLGHGLSLSVGYALSARMDKRDYWVVCMTGDGEMDEGSNWEAILYAASHNLDNIVAVVDFNHASAAYETNQNERWGEKGGPEGMADCFRAFGWNATVIDGTDMKEIDKTLAALPEVTLNGKPNAIICSTTKGQGVGFMMERPCAWHIGGFDDDKLAEAEKDIKEYTAKKLAEV